MMSKASKESLFSGSMSLNLPWTKLSTNTGRSVGSDTIHQKADNVVDDRMQVEKGEETESMEGEGGSDPETVELR